MLDALNRRRKFQGRQPTGKRIDLSPRDLAYFAALERHGPLSAPMLFALTKHLAANERGHKDRLTALYHETKTAHGGPYLERPEQQFYSTNALCQPMIYELTNAATQALREAGIPRQSLAPPSGPYLHRFLIAKITARAELKAAGAGHRFISSGEIARHPRFPEETLRTPKPLAVRVAGGIIIPDALYGVDFGGKFRFFAVEADRGTEPILGHGRLGNHLQGKIERYVSLLKAERFRLVWGIPVLTICIVTEQPVRADNLRMATARLVPDHLISRFVVEVASPSR
jgi:hypothetical protein